MAEYEYSWFFGRQIDNNHFEVFQQVLRENGDNDFVLLERGSLVEFNVDFELEDIPGHPEIVRIKFEYDEWPPGVPRPSPFDPKYPTRYGVGLPYGDAKVYKEMLDTLPDGLALRKGYDMTKDYVETGGHPLEAAFQDYKTMVPAQQDNAVKAIREWIAKNLDDDLVIKVLEALPNGLSRAGGRPFDEDWFPLGWETKVIYGYFEAIEA